MNFLPTARYALATACLFALGTSISEAGLMWSITDAGSNTSRVRLSGSLDLSGGTSIGPTGVPPHFAGIPSQQTIVLQGPDPAPPNDGQIVRFDADPSNPTDILNNAFFDFFTFLSSSQINLPSLFVSASNDRFAAIDYALPPRNGPIVFNEDFVAPVPFSRFIPGVFRYGDTSSPMAQGAMLVIGPPPPMPPPPAPVPEPTTFAMFGLGAIGLVVGGIRRKRRAT